jgi:GSH-dependent disulfide-bond oxidoreductase
MIDLYYWTTSNGHKITMLLEEAGLPYTIHPVSIGKGEQFDPAFVKISPNNRIPAIVDRAPADGGEPIAMFESGAILMYLADKAGRFIPNEPRARLDCIQWLFWQIANLGPMAGQNHYFSLFAKERIRYAIDRYVRETGRLYAVLNKQLADHEFIVDDYSIADMACYPWIMPERQAQNIEEFPNVKRWKQAIRERPATARAYALAKNINPVQTGPLSEAEHSNLFGQSKETVR